MHEINKSPISNTISTTSTSSETQNLKEAKVEGVSLTIIKNSSLNNESQIEEIKIEVEEESQLTNTIQSIANKTLKTEGGDEISGDEELEFEPTTLPLTPSSQIKPDISLAPLVQSVPANDLKKSVPTIDQKKLDDIRNRIANPDPKLSSQAFLSEIAKDLHAAFGGHPDIEIIIESELAKGNNGRYETEPFTLPNKPDETFYKTSVTYTFKVKNKGNGADIPLNGGDISVKRDAFTTSTTPENALLAASKFKETVIQLALNNAIDGYKGRLAGLPDKKDQKYNTVMTQRNFQFNFASDAAGRTTTALTSIQVGTHKLNLDVDPKTKSYRYVYDIDSGELERIGKNETKVKKANQTFVYFDTEEEAFINIKPVIKNDDFFDRLERSSKSIEQHIEEIKEDIKKKELEFAEIKSMFIKKPLIRLFSTEGKSTKQFEEYLADLTYDSQSKIDEKQLSLNKQFFIQTKKGLDEYISRVGQDQEKDLKILEELVKPNSQPSEEANKIIDKIVAAHQLPNKDVDQIIQTVKMDQRQIAGLRTELSELEIEIGKEQATFNRDLAKLTDLNKNLDRQLEQLKDARKKAESILQDPQKQPQKAQAFLKAFSNTEIAKLEKNIASNQKLIKGILNRLDLIGASKSTASDSIVVSETTEIPVITPTPKTSEKSEIS